MHIYINELLKNKDLRNAFCLELIFKCKIIFGFLFLLLYWFHTLNILQPPPLFFNSAITLVCIIFTVVNRFDFKRNYRQLLAVFLCWIRDNSRLPVIPCLQSCSKPRYPTKDVWRNRFRAGRGRQTRGKNLALNGVYVLQ